MSCAVGEEEVEDHADKREKEGDKDPEDLVRDWPVGLQYFDDNDDIQDQDNEPCNASASTITDIVTSSCNRLV